MNYQSFTKLIVKAYHFWSRVLSCERKTTLTTTGESWLYCVLQMFYTYKSAEMICLPEELLKCFSASIKHVITVQSGYSASQHISSPLQINVTLICRPKYFFLNVRESLGKIIQIKWKAEKKTTVDMCNLLHIVQTLGNKSLKC